MSGAIERLDLLRPSAKRIDIVEGKEGRYGWLLMLSINSLILGFLLEQFIHVVA